MPCNCRQGTGAHDHLGDNFMRDGVFGVGVPLNNSIDLPFLQIWNARTCSEDARRIFDPLTENNNDPLCSDDDPELLMFIPLSSVCRIRGISIVGPNTDFSPSQVKLFANPPEVHGFASVRRLVPQEEIQLAQVSSDDKIIYRLNPKFSSVSTLVLLFEHSFNDTETHLLRIELFGEDSGRPTAQRVVTNVVYEGMANPADHKSAEEHKRFFAVQ